MRVIRPLRESQDIHNRLLKTLISKEFQSSSSLCEELFQLLQANESSENNNEIINQLAELSSDRAIDILASIAFNQNYPKSTRFHALKALSNTETSKALDILKSKLGDSAFVEEIEAYALSLALKIGNPVSKEFWKQLGVKNAALKLFANFSFHQLEIYQKAFETLYELSNETGPHSEEAQELFLYAAQNFGQNAFIYEMDDYRWEVLQLVYKQLVKLGNDKVVDVLKQVIESGDIHGILAGAALVKIANKKGNKELLDFAFLKSLPSLYGLCGALLEKSQHTHLNEEELTAFFDLIHDNNIYIQFQSELPVSAIDYEQNLDALSEKEISSYHFQELLTLLTDENAVEVFLENDLENGDVDLEKIPNNEKLIFLLKKGLIWNLSKHSKTVYNSLLSFINSPDTPLSLKSCACYALASHATDPEKRSELLEFFQKSTLNRQAIKAFLSILTYESSLEAKELSMLALTNHSWNEIEKKYTMYKALKEWMEEGKNNLSDGLLIKNLVAVLAQEIQNPDYNTAFVASIIKLMLSIDKEKSYPILYRLLQYDEIAKQLINLYKDEKILDSLPIFLMWMHQAQPQSQYLDLIKKAPEL